MTKAVKERGPLAEVGEPASETMASMVYRRLHDDIIKGILKPGAKLRIEALTEQYDVGSSPVREALSRLSAENVVVRNDQRGFHVAPVSLEEWLELNRARCLLNEITVREAIKNGDADWEDGIVLTCNRLKRTPHSQEGNDSELNPLWEQRHKAFHRALIAACGSRWLLDFADKLFDSARRYRHLSLAANRNAIDEHERIMHAVLDRNAELAIRLMNDHIADSARVITEAAPGLFQLNRERTIRRARSR